MTPSSSIQPPGADLVDSLDRIARGAGVTSQQPRRLDPAPVLPAIPARVGSALSDVPSS
jgi:hypothetical protein